jgi:RND family efflux transporter MFP subunit
MTTTEDPVPSAAADLAPAVPPSIGPSIGPSIATSKRGPSWVTVVAVAVACAGGGMLAGWRVRGAQGPEPTKAMAGMASMPGMDSEAPAAPPGAGPSAVYISPGRQQLVGVRTALVDHQRVEGTVRTVGMLAYDETRTVQIHTRVSGWIEHLFVDYVGKAVRRGQPLFAVYSPDLSTAQSDYLVALKASQRPETLANPELKAGSEALLTASRDRMKRWDVSDAQIAELERAGHPTPTMTIASPFDGVVLEKNAFAGQLITPDMTTFKLADLSTIWVIGQVFEFEAARIRPGDTIDVEFPYGQARPLQARIEFVYPEVDPQTRRVRFRAVLPNVDRKLKPDTYVTLVWHGEPTDHVVVPREAVIDTGERKYVLLALAHGYFEPRDVTLGPPLGEVYPVVSGIAAGDRVVTSSQFLIDSETNLMAAMQGMAMSMPGMDMGKPAPPAGSAGAMPGMKMDTPAPAGSGAQEMPDMPGMPGMKMDAPHPMPGVNPPAATTGRATPARPSIPGMPGM